MVLPSAGGGRSLGSATAYISFDTGDAQRSALLLSKRIEGVADSTEALTERMDDLGETSAGMWDDSQEFMDQYTQRARDIKSTLENVAAQTEDNVAGVSQMAAAIQRLTSIVSGFGLVAAGLTLFGLGAAGNIRELELRVRTLVSSQEKAVTLMNALGQASGKLNIPLERTLTAAEGLAPSFRAGFVELERGLDLASRVALKIGPQGIGQAAEAVNVVLESQGKQLSQLAQILNMSEAELEAALGRQAGTLEQRLDAVLDQMGLTSDKAREMNISVGTMFSTLIERVTGLFSIAFTPLFNNVFIPLIDGLTEMVRKLSEVNPHLLEMAGVVISIAAVIPVITAAIGAMSAASTTLLPVLLRLAPVAAALAAGAIIGVGATRAVGQATGREDLASFELKDLAERLQQVFVLTGEAVRSFGLALITAQVAIKSFILGLATTAATRLPPGRVRDTALAEIEASRTAIVDEALLASQGFNDVADSINQFTVGVSVGVQKTQEAASTITDIWDSIVEGTHQFSDEELAAWGQLQQALIAVDTKTAEAKLSIAIETGRRLTAIEESNARQRERSLQDEGLRRLRAEASLNRTIDGIRQARNAREAEADREFKARQSEKDNEDRRRAAERLEDHQRRMHQMRRDHRMRLLEAARSLNAVGVLNELRSFQNRKQQAEDDFSIQQSRAAAAIQRRRAQDKAAHEIRLAEARDADTQRINDLRARFEREEALIAEDRELREERQQEDYDRQVAALTDQSIRRQAQLDDQAEKERNVLEQNFRISLNRLMGHEQAKLDVERWGRSTLEAELRRWWTSNIAWLKATQAQASESAQRSKQTITDFGGTFADDQVFLPAGTGASLSTSQRAALLQSLANLQGFQEGGPVRDTGLAMVHRGEFVLSERVVNALRDGQAQAAGGVTFDNPTFVFGDIGQMTPDEVMEFVRQGVAEVFRST